MRSTAIQLVPAALVSCFIVMWGAQHMAGQGHTPVTVTRLYTGPDGETHAEQIDVKLTPNSTLARFEESKAVEATGLQFRRWSPGYVNDWHPAPRRQYVITVSGRGEVELMRGQKIPAQPGKVVLAEDMKGKGHITRTLGREDWITIAVPLADK